MFFCTNNLSYLQFALATVIYKNNIMAIENSSIETKRTSVEIILSILPSGRIDRNKKSKAH